MTDKEIYRLLIKVDKGYTLTKEFPVFTKEDAKKYLYSIDNRRRIIKWDDIKVRIFV